MVSRGGESLGWVGYKKNRNIGSEVQFGVRTGLPD